MDKPASQRDVTIVFDNSDRENSPPGELRSDNGDETGASLACKRVQGPEHSHLTFDNHQIALPNISKYLLNGYKPQPKIIQTIFQSVQLNIKTQIS